MPYFQEDEYLKKTRWRWFWGLLIPFVIYAYWDASDSLVAGAFLSYRLVVMPIFLYFVTPYLARWSLKMHYESEERQEIDERAAAAKAALEFNNQALKEHAKETKRRRESTHKANSLDEIIGILASIDTYIRVLEHTTDPKERVVTLQQANRVIMKLTAMVAAGDVSRAELANEEIKELAEETSQDLVRLGLANDRLNREIVRLFGLTKTD
jgi:hypothetical protein